MLGEHVNVAVAALESVLESNRATAGGLVHEVHGLSASRDTEASGELAAQLGRLGVAAVGLRVGERLGHRSMLGLGLGTALLEDWPNALDLTQ